MSSSRRKSGWSSVSAWHSAQSNHLRPMDFLVRNRTHRRRYWRYIRVPIKDKVRDLAFFWRGRCGIRTACGSYGDLGVEDVLAGKRLAEVASLIGKFSYTYHMVEVLLKAEDMEIVRVQLSCASGFVAAVINDRSLNSRHFLFPLDLCQNNLHSSRTSHKQTIALSFRNSTRCERKRDVKHHLDSYSYLTGNNLSYHFAHHQNVLMNATNIQCLNCSRSFNPLPSHRKRR